MSRGARKIQTADGATKKRRLSGGLTVATKEDDVSSTSAPAKRPRGDKVGASKRSKKAEPVAEPLKTSPMVSSTLTKQQEAASNPGTLYSFGTNTCGQLALSPDAVEKRKFPSLCEYFRELKLSISGIAAGGMHSVVLTSSGDVYTFGCNDEGALGRPIDSEDAEEDSAKPGKVELPDKAVSITAGSSHSAALLSDGTLYAWGTFRDGNGHYGLVPGDGNEAQPLCHMAPCKVNFDEGTRPASIASGNDHLVILDVDGNILTFGASSDLLGRVSRVTRRNAAIDEKTMNLTPRQVIVPGHKKFKNIYAGNSSTFCVEDGNKGTVWGFGLNTMLQLGVVKPKAKMIVAPVKSPAITNHGFIKIAVGEFHCLGLTADGKVFSWGKPYEGQLGLGEKTPKEPISSPTEVEFRDKVVDIACGHSVSYALTSSGQLFSWGFGENYQLGSKGDEEDSDTPQLVLVKIRGEPAQKVRVVSAGGQHALLVGDYGLGAGDEETPMDTSI